MSRQRSFVMGFILGIGFTLVVVIGLALWGCTQTIIVGDGHGGTDKKQTAGRVESTEVSAGAKVKITKER